MYERIDAPATPEQKAVLLKLSPAQVQAAECRRRKDRGDADHRARQRRAHRRVEGGDGNGWFAARPSGTESVYKMYAESFLGEEHLRRIQQEAQELIAQTFASVTSGAGG